MKKTGESLSILGYGCMRLPERNMMIEEKKARAQIYGAIEKGVNYIDTGFMYHYGASEPFLGKILDKDRRNRIKLATKLPPMSVRTREDMDGVLNNQLKRLNTDRIDYYLLHGIDGKSWNKLLGLGVMDFLDAAKRDGRIRFAGFSFHGQKDQFKEIVDAYDWHFCQIQYNYFDQNTQAGTAGLEYAAEKGLGVIVMEPMRGGLLTTRVPADVRAVWDRAEMKRTSAEWALRWVWNRKEVTVVLSGMNEDGHVEENIRIASEARPDSLTPQELALVEEARARYGALMKVGCTGCRYCMPCPKGVDIPFCFEIYNRVRSFGEQKLENLVRYAIMLGGFEKGNRAYASQCVECGACEKKCPQHLPIPAHLKEVEKEFQTLFFRIFVFCSKIFFRLARRGFLGG